MASSSSPSSPNDPPFSFLSRIKVAFNHASMALQSRLRTALEGRAHNSDPSINWSIQHEVPQISLGTSIIMTHRMQVPPAQNITTRVRYWRSNPSEEGLPLYYNVYDIKMQRHQPLTSVSLGKTFMGLIFQAAIGFMALSVQSSSSSSSSQAKDIQPPLFRLHVIEVAMMIGFTGLLIGILLRHAYPSMARVMEMMGYIFSIIEFFVMVSTFLPPNIMWIGWLLCVLSLLACVLAFIK